MEAILELTDIVTQIRHKLYLRSFENEFEAKQFTLDGSDWARLVLMRKQSQKHMVRGVFWTKVHSTESPLHRERKARQRGLQHWFLNDTDSYELLWRYASQETSADLSYRQLLCCLSENPVSISDTEAAWFRSKSSAQHRLPNSDQSAFWLEAEKGAFEGGTGEKKRLLIAATRH